MRTLRWIALVAILLALGGVASAQEQEKEHPLLTKTKQLIKEGKLKEAEEAYLSYYNQAGKNNRYVESVLYPDPAKGQYVETTTADGKRYEGYVKNNIPNGEGLLIFADSSSYDGEFLNGKMHGMGLCKWPNGSSYYGEWKEGQMDGEGYMSYIGQAEYNGEWKEGKRHGF